MGKSRNKPRKKSKSGSQSPKMNKNIDAKEILRLANIIYFRSQVYDKTRWMGVRTAKCPMDMWMYQELIFRLKTDLIIETGTLNGGSASFFAHMLDIMGRGKVITIDINDDIQGRPQHQRIEYIKGSSIDPDVVNSLMPAVREANSVMVILDADHRAPFKLQELELYSPLVSVGNYIIAEDSCFDEYPAWPEYGPGPATAIKEFIERTDRFEIDRELEQHMITFAPRGFIKRIA